MDGLMTAVDARPTRGCWVPARAQPRAAGAAGGDRQLVRAPAGQALRGGDGGLGDGLLARDPLRQREDLRRDAADRSSASATGGPVSIQLFGEDPAMMRSAAAHVAARRRRCDRHQHGLSRAEGAQDGRRRGDARRPRSGGGGRARRGRGRGAGRARAAGHGEAALGAARRGRAAALRWRIAWWKRRGSRRSPFIRARRRCTTRAFPTMSSPRGWWHSLPAPVILTGGLSDAAHAREAFEATGAAAVMLARGALGNPWLFRAAARTASGVSPRARRSWRSSTGRSTARSSTRRAARDALPAQVLPLVRAPGCGLDPRPSAQALLGESSGRNAAANAARTPRYTAALAALPLAAIPA